MGRPARALAAFADLQTEIGRIDQARVGGVDEPVTIVVLAVAHLGSVRRALVFAAIRGIVVGVHPAFGAGPFMALRIENAYAANTSCVGMREAALVTTAAAVVGIGVHVEPVVDDAVAVVVLAVAHLDRRRDHAATDEAAVRAHEGAELALGSRDAKTGGHVATGDPGRIADLAEVGVGLVDAAIAVVVAPIADFLGRRTRAHADQLARGAS